MTDKKKEREEHNRLWNWRWQNREEAREAAISSQLIKTPELTN
jgi:hypothetical protein